MITIIKRIGEFAKDFNELVDELYKITPTATRMEVVYKPFDYYEKIQYEEDGYWEEEAVEYNNTSLNIVKTKYTFPNYKDFEIRAELFYKDCDYLILHKKDDLLVSLSKIFKYPQIYPSEIQFCNAKMYNEQILLNTILEIWSVVNNYQAGHGYLYDAIEERRKELLQIDEPRLVEENIRPIEILSEDEITLPSELNTENARKYFFRAIQKGYLKKDGNTYKWLFGGNRGQARLGYFCNKVFTPPRPINKLEEIFGVKKLSASITSSSYETKTVGVKMWREKMDNEIFND